MEFEKTNKKVKYIIVGEVVLEPGEDKELETALDALRSFGEAEIVDIQVFDPDEEEDS